MRDNFPKRPVLRRRYLARGFSLLELMISLLISLVIIAAVGYIYVGNRGAFRAQTADSRMTDNARIAIEFLTRDLRQSAKFGCTRTDMSEPNKIDGGVVMTAVPPFMSATSQTQLEAFLLPPNASPTRLVEPGRMVRAYDDAVNFTGPSLPSTSPRRLNTDVLEIMKADNTGSHLTIPMASLNSNLLLTNSLPGAAPGNPDVQTFLVSDCNTSEIVKGQVNASGSAPGGALNISNAAWNNGGRLSKSFGVDATVSRFAPVVYMIQNPSSDASVQTPRLIRFGLLEDNDVSRVGGWINTINANSVIADGIEDLQIRFGVATAGLAANAPDQYMTATQIDAAGVDMWRNVRSAEITISVISERANVSTTTTAEVNGSITDRRLRQQIIQVVSLRNARQ